MKQDAEPAIATSRLARFRWTAAAILVLALLLRAIALTGEMLPDSLAYAQYAWNLVEGTFTLRTDSWFAHRVPVFAPTALCYAAFGVHPWTTAAWSLTLSLVMIAATIAAGARRFGPATGLLAGLLLALYPLDVSMSCKLMPDEALAALLGIGAALWWLADGRRPGPQAGLLAMAGACLGLATVVRAYALLGAVFVGADAWLRRVPARRLVVVALGFLIVLAPTLLTYAVVTGDALYPHTIVARFFGSGALAEGSRPWYYPSHFRYLRSVTGLYPWVLLASLLWSVRSPGRDRLALIIWILCFGVFLQFGSMSLTHYVPIIKTTRYLTPLTFPAAVFAASVMAGVAGWTTEHRRWMPAHPTQRRVLRSVVVLGLVVLAGYSSWQVVKIRGAELPRARACQTIARLVRSAPGTPVLLDHWRSAIRLAYYLQYREGAGFYRDANDRLRMNKDQLPAGTRLGFLVWYPRPEDLPDAFVLIDDAVLDEFRRESPRGLTYTAGDIPAYAFDPPRTWTRVFDGADMHLFRTAPRLGERPTP